MSKNIKQTNPNQGKIKPELNLYSANTKNINKIRLTQIRYAKGHITP